MLDWLGPSGIERVHARWFADDFLIIDLRLDAVSGAPMSLTLLQLPGSPPGSGTVDNAELIVASPQFSLEPWNPNPDLVPTLLTVDQTEVVSPSRVDGHLQLIFGEARTTSWVGDESVQFGVTASGELCAIQLSPRISLAVLAD